MELPSRQTIRIQDFNYAQAGAYAITIVTHKRLKQFGVIEDEQTKLDALARMVEQELHRLPIRFPGIQLDEYVVMPNHVHMILVIKDHINPSKEGFGKPVKGSIPTIVRSFKSSTTQRFQRMNDNLPVGPFWQRNYYEHVIRDETDWGRIRDYIQMNPQRWAEDSEFSA